MITTKEPLVSFLIAAYNEEDYIRECINSCLQQSYKNIEICVVDDGSEDRTWEILCQYQTEFENVISYRLDRNMGKVAAFNKAFELCNGEFIAVMGADDVASFQRIEVSLKAIGSSALLFGDLKKFNDAGEISSSVMEEEHNLTGDSEFSFSELLFNPIVYGGTILLRKNAVVDLFPIDSRLSHEDWWIPLWCARKDSVKYTHSKMINYRIHSEQTSGSRVKGASAQFSRWKYLECRDIFYYEHIKSSCNLTDRESSFVLQELMKKKLYNENSIIQRLRIIGLKGLFTFTWKVNLIAFIGPIGGYALYRFRNMVMK